MNFPVKLTQPLPKPGDAGFFGAVRKHDIHTGIDLYCDDGAEVSAICDGVVVNIEKFTGEHCDFPSPWWNNTWSILIESEHGVIVYGELVPLDSITIGQSIKTGQLIGHVKQVLKEDKGKNSPSMLHLEYLVHGSRETLWWHLDQEQPKSLMDPIWLINTLTYYKYVMVFPDWMATGVWDKFGTCVPLEWLPVSDATKQLIADMAKEFDSCGFTDYNNDSHYTCPEGVNYFWDDRSKAIIEKIKNELPEWEVEYHE